MRSVTESTSIRLASENEGYWHFALHLVKQIFHCPAFFSADGVGWSASFAL
jgi:hypothetical protein